MLTATEIAALVPEAKELYESISEAFGPESDGGTRLTRKELRRLGWACLRFGIRLLADVVD